MEKTRIEVLKDIRDWYAKEGVDLEMMVEDTLAPYLDEDTCRVVESYRDRPEIFLNLYAMRYICNYGVEEYETHCEEICKEFGIDLDDFLNFVELKYRKKCITIIIRRKRDAKHKTRACHLVRAEGAKN